MSPLGQQGTLQITESEAFGRAFDSGPIESKDKNTQLVTFNHELYRIKYRSFDSRPIESKDKKD